MPEDCNAGETFRLRSGLCSCDCGLECRGCGIAFSSLGYDESDSDELMRVCKSKEIVPILLVEPGKWCEDEDGLLVCSGIG